MTTMLLIDGIFLLILCNTRTAVFHIRTHTQPHAGTRTHTKIQAHTHTHTHTLTDLCHKRLRYRMLVTVITAMNTQRHATISTPPRQKKELLVVNFEDLNPKY